MDVTPATSQDLVQVETQASIDALRRLAATREAFAQMLEARPSLKQADGPGAKAVLDALHAFWASGTTDGVSRTEILGRYLASVMKEEGILRGLDGTLSERATALVSRLANGNTSPDSGIRVRELLLGDVPHAGSLIVLEEGRPDLALLFTAHGGWEAYDSLDRLLESTRRTLLASVDVIDGRGLDDDEFSEAKKRNTVGSHEIAGDVFDKLARRMIEVSQRRVALAADDFELDAHVPDAAIDLADRMRFELSPSAMLDIDAIESLREARLLEAVTASRLNNVTGDVRDAWYAARDAYNRALAGTAMTRVVTGAQPPLTLHAFASAELAAKLASFGIDQSPESISVNVARIKVLPDALGFLDPLPGSTDVRHMSLVDFACQNIGRFSLDTLEVIDSDGHSLGDRLGHGVLRDMVRELDIANRYQGHLESRLRKGPSGALAQKLATTMQSSRMRLQAADARLSYYLPGEPRSFIDDREGRGYRWVEAALDAPDAKPHVGGHEIAVSQLTYMTVPLDGILIFASRAPDSAPRVVMYTPDAPDGIAFREFESRQDAAKRFLYHPAFREYLLDHLPVEFSTVLPNGALRQFAGDRLAHWVLGASKNASYTLTAEPFDQREVHGDFLVAAYNATVERHLRDTRFLARSTADADHDAILGHIRDRFNITTTASVLATVLAEVPASLARVTQASWRFYDHVKAGDAGQAFIDFAEGYGNAVSLIGPPFVGGRHVASAIVRSRFAKSGVTVAAVPPMQPRVRFDDRYAVGRLRKAGKPDDEGIVRAHGKTYIEQDGTHYLVNRDASYDRWRLAPPQGAIDMQFTGPLIERLDGRWLYANDVGLRGGMRRLRQRMNRLLRDEGAPPAANAAPGAAAEPALVPPAPLQRPLALHPVMEPMRAEITAVLTDNPSALVLVRPDGSHLKVIVRPRSALILDPHLHPDIAELSAHQRRIFLHELDRRFPLQVERAEVLEIQGWANTDGRRIPSPPTSPGAAVGTDVQVPDISSSTGGPQPATPTLTPMQQVRWDEALGAARGAPRVPEASAPSASSAMAAETLPVTEIVPRSEWPERMWYFSDRRFRPEYLQGLRRDGVVWSSEGAWVDAATDIHTYPVSVLPPETPLSRLAEALGASPVQQAGQPDRMAYAMLIDMTRLRDPLQVQFGRFAMREMELELHRRLLPNGEYQYTLRSFGRVHIPSDYVVSVGRRGGHPTTLPAVRH
jgi:hypothetical protein